MSVHYVESQLHPLLTTYKNRKVERPVCGTTDVKLVGGQEKGKRLKSRFCVTLAYAKQIKLISPTLEVNTRT
jgi:hypothetical protein